MASARARVYLLRTRNAKRRAENTILTRFGGAEGPKMTYMPVARQQRAGPERGACLRLGRQGPCANRLKSDWWVSPVAFTLTVAKAMCLPLWKAGSSNSCRDFVIVDRPLKPLRDAPDSCTVRGSCNIVQAWSEVSKRNADRKSPNLAGTQAAQSYCPAF